MTSRDMSYDLDSIFASRMAGELQGIQTTRTKVLRSPGLHVISQKMAHKLPYPHVKHIGHGMYVKSTDLAGADDPMGVPTGAPPGSMAEAQGGTPGAVSSSATAPGIKLPMVGEVDYKSLAVGAAAAAFVLVFLLKR